MNRTPRRACFVSMVLVALMVSRCLAARPGLDIQARLPDGSILEHVEEGSVLPGGAGLRFRLKSDGAEYIYLIAIGSSGNAQMVYPYGEHSNGEAQPIRPSNNGLVWVPRSSSIFLPLIGKPGREVFIALTSQAGIGDWDSLITDVRQLGTDVSGLEFRLNELGFEVAVISIEQAPPRNEINALPRLDLGKSQEEGVLSEAGRRIPKVQLQKP